MKSSVSLHHSYPHHFTTIAQTYFIRTRTNCKAHYNIPLNHSPYDLSTTDHLVYSQRCFSLSLSHSVNSTYHGSLFNVLYYLPWSWVMLTYIHLPPLSIRFRIDDKSITTQWVRNDQSQASCLMSMEYIYVVSAEGDRLVRHNLFRY